MKRIILVAIGLVFTLSTSHAQIRIAFSGEYDEKAPLHVGIFYTYMNARYIAEKSKDWTNQSTQEIGNIRAIWAPSGHGIGLGIPIDYRINSNLNLMFSPTFVVSQNQQLRFIGNIPVVHEGDTISAFLYKRHKEEPPLGNVTTASNPADKSTVDRGNFPAFEFPLHFKFRSDPKYLNRKQNMYKMYLLAGAKYTTHIGRNKFYNNLDFSTTKIPLVVRSGFFSYEAGVGLDIFFPYFKLSPELRFSQSVNSLLDKNHPGLIDYPSPYMNSLDRLLLRSFQFSLFFE